MKTLETVCGRDQNSFGLVRLAAAIAVVISHAYLLTGGALTSEPLSVTTDYPLGAHAVHVFFALSGFLIAMSWHNKPDLFHFLAGRFLRLFPALLIVTLAVVVTGSVLMQSISPFLYAFSPEVIFFFVRTVLLLDGGGQLPSIFPQDESSGAILATVWTLRYEVICYLSIPLLALLSLGNKRAGMFMVAGVIIVSAALLTMRDNGYHEAALIDHLARFFFAFYLGVAAWMLRKHLPLNGFLALTLCLIAYFTLGSAISKHMEILALAYATFWLGSFRLGALTSLTNSEDLSYGVYLMGYPVQQALLASFPENQSPIANAALTLLLVVPVALLSWRIIERPALVYRGALAKFGDHLLAGITYNIAFSKTKLEETEVCKFNCDQCAKPCAIKRLRTIQNLNTIK